MKYIVYLYVLGLHFIGFSQSHNNSPFLDSWVWNSNNNLSFIVHFYEDEKMIKGDYMLVEKDDPNIIIYKSNKLVDKEFQLFFGHAIYGNSNDGKAFIGNIKDNVLLGDHIHTIKHGALSLILKNKDTLLWRVTPLKIYNRRKRRKVPENFTIPTDIILIRQKK